MHFDEDEFDAAFSDRDEPAVIVPSRAPRRRLARGSQSLAVPPAPRTVTLEDPVTTGALARSTRRRNAPTTLEQALLALADGVPELIPTD